MITLDDYVIDTLLPDLVAHDRRPATFLVYLWMAAAAQRHKNAPVTISYSNLAEAIGISKSSAQAAVSWLVRRKLLSVSKQTVTATPRYTVHSPWREGHRRG